MDLKDKHVFITGAAKRLGRAMADAMLPRGIKLSAHYFKSEKEVRELKGKVVAIQADLRAVDQLRAAVKKAEAAHGPIDILINSASDFYPTPIFEATETQWDALLDTNLKGQFFLAQAAAEKMQAKGGVILNLADVGGERPVKKYTPYGISKAGVLMLTRQLATEFAPKIRVNSISPGPVLMPEHYTPEQVQRSADRSLFGRIGSPDDIVNAALFLIGNDYVTGIDLKVDGGRSLT